MWFGPNQLRKWPANTDQQNYFNLRVMNMATKKTASKKSSTKKKTVVKKTTAKKAPTKKTSTKKPATGKKKSSTVKKKSASSKKSAIKEQVTNPLSVSAEERWRMVANAAYHRAEARGFAPGNELQDWIAAEKDIDKLLSRK